MSRKKNYPDEIRKNIRFQKEKIDQINDIIKKEDIAMCLKVLALHGIWKDDRIAFSVRKVLMRNGMYDRVLRLEKIFKLGFKWDSIKNIPVARWRYIKTKEDYLTEYNKSMEKKYGKQK